ncbi:hypothetical protein H8958_013324 [Nasalis larvatus]
MLQTDPTARPTINEQLNNEFFTSGYIPASLPITCLTILPRFSIAPSSPDPSNRKPLTVLNKLLEKTLPESPREKEEPAVSETVVDNSVEVLFNDGDSLQYIKCDVTESYFTVNPHPNSLMKKITLFKYVHSYLSKHLLKAGANITLREGNELARLPYLRTWFRTRSAIILHLSNGSVQINFFQDHINLILCPPRAAVAYIDKKRNFHT